METVFVIGNGKAHLRLVKTGKRFGGEVEVLSGIESGEQVVTEGANLLADGQPVEVKSL
jgi:multidrug efflux pump subunit AcrA (membrane-fusion protein)